MFLIRSSAGEKFVLRIYSDEETTLKENQAEMFWLDALKRDTDLKVTEPIPRRDGKYISITNQEGVPPDRRCVLFKWIPGRPLENYLSYENYYKLGQALAKLHNHAESLNPLPIHIQPKRWDKVFYYPDEPVVYNTSEYSYLFPPERVELLENIIDKSENMFSSMFADQRGLMLIHGDLHFWNVHYFQGELYLIDFEDVNLGYPIQDIAVTLYYGRQRDGYAEWKAGLISGYKSIRVWPEGGEETIDTLMAARAVMFINYVARVTPSPEEFIKARCEDLLQYINTYD
jgi:Ser/Thr protein kinase RdoA (MazF antagonist)